MKLILEFCDIYGIDMRKELIDKINYNNSRPKDYRKIGNSELLETDTNRVYRQMLQSGYGMYKATEDVIRSRQEINNIVLKKREARRELEEEEEQI